MAALPVKMMASGRAASRRHWRATSATPNFHAMAIREVVDDHGRAWTVFAVVPDSYDDRIGIAAGYSRGWLCFWGDGQKWRLLGIPNGWEALDDVAIVELMWEAVPVRVTE